MLFKYSLLTERCVLLKWHFPHVIIIPNVFFMLYVLKLLLKIFFLTSQ